MVRGSPDPAQTAGGPELYPDGENEVNPGWRTVADWVISHGWIVVHHPDTALDSESFAYHRT